MTTNSNPETIKQETAFEAGTFKKSFTRSCTLDASWNYERMQNLAFAYMMIPILKQVCKTKEQMAAGLKRHLEFFSTTPHICTLLIGILGSMEKENVEREDFDESSINAVKASLMGPMAAIGDSLIWGTLRVIAAGIAISFSMNGNILGPILFFIIINAPCFALRYACLNKGVEFGTQFLKNINDSGIMQKITYGASVLGLMVIGSMVASMVYFELPLMVGSGDFAEPIQAYFDELMPCLLPLGAFGIMYYLLGKNVKTTALLLGIFVVSIAGTFIGIF